MLHIIIKIIVLTQTTKVPQDVISYVHKRNAYNKLLCEEFWNVATGKRNLE